MSIYLLGSNNLRVGLDSSGRIQELHYPHLGSNNHTPGSVHHRIGVYVDGRLSWLDANDGWRVDRKTTPQALIPHTVAENRSLGVILEFIDVVDDKNDSLIRNIHIVNMDKSTRDIKLFMHQSYIFNSNSYEDFSGSYSKPSNSIVHHGLGVSFASSLFQIDGESFDQHTIGRFGSPGLEGTYMDALDGTLEQHDHDVGHVDSTMRLSLSISPMGSVRAGYVLTAGTNPESSIKLNYKVRSLNLSDRTDRIAKEWREWLKPAIKVLDRIDESMQHTFLSSLMTMRAHIDTSGAVMTHRPNGSSIYSSPLIAGYVVWPLIRLGYRQEVEKYFDFMKKSLRDGDLAKSLYSSDGSEGYSDFGMDVTKAGRRSGSIDIDNSAMLVFMFSQLYSASPSNKLLDKYYESMIVPLLNNLSDYIDRSTGLPSPSHSLFGDSQPVQSAYSASIVFSALLCGADIAEVKRDALRAVSWRSAADEVLRGVNSELVDKDNLRIREYVGYDFEEGVDVNSFAAGYGLFIFGLLASDDGTLTSTYEAVKRSTQRGDGGRSSISIDRNYKLGRDGEDFPVAALWLAQYEAEMDSVDSSMEILSWVRDTYLEPFQQSGSGEARNASELAGLWTRAEYVSTLLDLITEPGGSN